MTIVEQLTEDMKASMKAGDADRTGVLRLLRGALKNEQIKVGHEIGDDEALKVLQREAKQRRDSIDAYRRAGRTDLEEHEEAELTVISEYLPEVIGEDELGKVVDEAMAEIGATDAKQMGAVIGAVMKRVGARADGAAVSRLVREKLAS
ncbi:MAG TPA: GatB/YqeY domain-containing protein [Candidatus Saccharimonadia bacterium]